MYKRFVYRQKDNKNEAIVENTNNKNNEFMRHILKN